MTESSNADTEIQSTYHVHGGTYRNTATLNNQSLQRCFNLGSLSKHGICSHEEKLRNMCRETLETIGTEI